MFADRLAFTRIPDFAALLETQRRLLESLARSTRIVADAARGCSEHQAALARLALNELTSCMLPAGAALAPACCASALPGSAPSSSGPVAKPRRCSAS